jgi:hypothetical protein
LCRHKEGTEGGVYTVVVVCGYASDCVHMCVCLSPSMYNGFYAGIGKIKLQK